VAELMEDKPRLHVLVVDDHPAMASRLAEMVERAGFRASVALSGRAGLAAFSAAQSAGSPFSAIITDFSMADLDGMAVAAAVKKASPSTAVILLTAYVVSADDPLPRNVDAILTKPASDQRLRSTLTQLTAHG
jgi:CheY-like chemotaxis protein